MSFSPINLLVGLGLAVAVSLAAWRANALNPQGAFAAALLGMVIFGLGGLGWAILLLGFFLSSSALSRLFKQRKVVYEEKFSKGTRRDAGQVLANGGVAGLFVLAHLFFPAAQWPWLAFAGALAAANADTWATELGVFSQGRPRLITTGQPVERGASGGVSGLGLLAAGCGSLLIALLAVLFWQGRVASTGPIWAAGLLGLDATQIPLSQALFWVAGISLAGFAGSLLDSWLGATVQAIYTCPACHKETERHPLHTCGTPTIRLRGWSWLDNDRVNTFCTLAGALVALLWTQLL